MSSEDRRLGPIWRRTAELGWPIAVEQSLTTLMRTVDVLVTGLFSPAAVAAVGLADLYANIVLRVGLGLGTGAIALSSQDTGRGAAVTRDRAITQAMVVGTLIGLPFVAVGFLFSQALIAVLGAESVVVRLGGSYLMIVFAAAPMRILGLVGARALQGTGDTRTPMLVNGTANVLNIVLTVGLGLGVWVAPRMGIVGVGVATAVARTFAGLALTAAIVSPRTTPSFAWPRDPTITRQLVAVSVPNFAEGMSSTVARFPFNAIVLLFGTEANAAYHIGRRIYQQLTGPLYRSFGTVSSILVGQTLGEGRPEHARFIVGAILVLSVGTMTAAGGILFGGAEVWAGLFTSDPTTLGHAVGFTRSFAVGMLFFGVFFPLAGALRAAGDTRTPFYARFVGAFGFMLGGSYLLGVVLGYGLAGVYVALVSSYACWVAVAAAGFRWGGWAETAASMMADRAAADEEAQRLD